MQVEESGQGSGSCQEASVDIILVFSKQLSQECEWSGGLAAGLCNGNGIATSSICKVMMDC